MNLYKCTSLHEKGAYKRWSRAFFSPHVSNWLHGWPVVNRVKPRMLRHPFTIAVADGVQRIPELACRKCQVNRKLADGPPTFKLSFIFGRWSIHTSSKLDRHFIDHAPFVSYLLQRLLEAMPKIQLGIRPVLFSLFPVG